MQEYQQRVIVEKSDLDEKIDKLTSFIDSKGFPALLVDEQHRLVRQLHYMGEYTAMLDERINNF